MNRDYLAMILIMAISILLLLVFVRRGQVRQAFLALMVAQLFSWPITLLYVQFGLQSNPVRLFPHATESNFLFAFIFHPSVFTVYYSRYPKKARKSLRLLYTALIVVLAILFQLTTSLLTSLVEFKSKLFLIISFIIIFSLYNISRLYLNRYLSKLRSPGRIE